MMMLMRIDAERFAEGHQQVFLVQLRITLHGLVFNAGRDLAQLGHRLFFELVISH